MNYVQILFSLFTTSVIACGSLINYFEKYLPQFISQSFRYGKFSVVGKKSILTIEVPKSWFKHFYVLAVILFTYLLSVIIAVYLCEFKVPYYLLQILDTLCGEERYAHTSKNKIFIAVSLLTLQVYRRFFDTHYVSVFGEKSRINFSHYIIGHIHYAGALLAILCEAPVFAKSTKAISDAPFQIFDLTLSEMVSISIFLLAWRHQQICTRILAELRKNSKGKVVTNEYSLPNGDWFEYLTAPHQTTEIIMYASIMWLLWNNITWFFVFTWVLANQVETILLTHWWYQENFKNFPKKRKALIPFVY